MATNSEALAIAVEHHRAGRLNDAEEIYRQILAVDPDDADALHLLGVIASQVGKNEVAVKFISRAIELKGTESSFHNNLGHVLQNQRRLDEAVASYRRALELKPEFAEAHNNLGNTFQAKGNLEQALTCFNRALELKPEFAEAHNNLGNALKAERKLEQAVACYRRALELKPEFAEAYYSLGTALQTQGKLSEAVDCLRRALELRPEFAESYNSLGNALQAQAKLEEAIESFRQALLLKPDFAEAHNNLGVAFQTRGKLDEAVACFRRALDVNPNYAEAHSNLGTVFKDQGKLDEAVGFHRRALELKPESCAIHGSLLYTLWFCAEFDSSAIFEEHCRWSKDWVEPLAKKSAPHANCASPNRRLRIGYVSPDFRNHCQASFTVPLFSAHDQEQFEIVCYSDVVCSDGFTARLRSSVSKWTEIVGLTDEEVARLVRQDQIDILVDLTMHMAGGRPLVFARKPAPVQVCWLAYPGTTGNTAIDYRLTDSLLDPPGLSDRHYVEESVRLADTFWCYDPLSAEPAVNALPALSKGHVTFGSLNNFCKVNTGILKLWAQVLRAVEGSRLVLLAPEGSSRLRVLDELEQAGVRRERVAFVSHRPRQQYLELYHHIDIGLDTLPYNGHTTSLDALWMGVPVVTIVGQTVVGRAGLSQLTNLELTELVAESPDAFVRIAAELASDLKRLSDLRGSLRGRMERSPLMDAPRFARSMEVAYRTMWQRWCARADR